MKIQIIILAFFTITRIDSQIINYRFYSVKDSLCLEINENTEMGNTFSVNYPKRKISGNRSKPVDSMGYSEMFRYVFSEGTFKYKNNIIILYDKKLQRYYNFKRVDNYTLVAKKHTALFTKGDTLKLYYKYDGNDSYIQGMNWENGKRAGLWINYYIGNDTINFTEYKNDKVVKQYKKKNKESELKTIIYMRPLGPVIKDIQ